MTKILKLALLGTSLMFATLGTASAQFLPWFAPFSATLPASIQSTPPQNGFEGRSVVAPVAPRHKVMHKHN
jgi:hypothetical protein